MVEQSPMQRFDRVCHGTGFGPQLRLDACEHAIRHRRPQRRRTADCREPLAQVPDGNFNGCGCLQVCDETVELANATERGQAVPESATDRHTVALKKCPYRGEFFVGPTEDREVVPVRARIKSPQAFDLRSRGPCRQQSEVDVLAQRPQQALERAKGASLGKPVTFVDLAQGAAFDVHRQRFPPGRRLPAADEGRAAGGREPSCARHRFSNAHGRRPRERERRRAGNRGLTSINDAFIFDLVHCTRRFTMR